MTDRAHHSIGEVLSLLKEDYADVTISKIRFLESQGLIDPERTPSGYRKFYDDDIERLRWILAQQRDNFLPLKVIKRRLEDAGFELPKAATGPDDPLPEPTLFAKRIDDHQPVAYAATRVARTPDVEPAKELDPAGEPRAKPARTPGSTGETHDDPLATPPGSVSLSPGELAAAAGVDLSFVVDLERLGLVEPVDTDEGSTIYDHEALVVTRAAATFADHGLEPRLLRMFKVAAEREAGVFEQLTMPLVRRGGEARARARTELSELARLGETIHRSVLRRSLGSSLD